MANHCMLDLETLGVSADCVVLTFGAVKFDPFGPDEPSQPLYLKIDVDEQTAKGRTINPDTVAWWGRQSEAAQEEAFDENGRISIDSFLNEVSKYIVGCDKIWAQGVLFDINILEHLYKSLERPVPWQYWQIRDSRTVLDMGDDSVKTKNLAAHNALADAFVQAMAVQEIYKQCGVIDKR